MTSLPPVATPPLPLGHTTAMATCGGARRLLERQTSEAIRSLPVHSLCPQAQHFGPSAALEPHSLALLLLSVPHPPPLPCLGAAEHYVATWELLATVCFHHKHLADPNLGAVSRRPGQPSTWDWGGAEEIHPPCSQKFALFLFP